MRLLSWERGDGFSVCLAAQTPADFSVTSPEPAWRVIGNPNVISVLGRRARQLLIVTLAA